MTTQLSLLDRAKQGDAGAIAALMNDVLTTQAIWVKATLDADCLQVMLKAPAPLNQATCIAFIRRGLVHLQPEAIAQVRAYAWRVGDAFPLWIATFALEQPSMERLVSTPAPLLQPTQLGASPTNVTPSLQQPAQTLTLPPSTTVRQRSDFFKLSFVIVLATMIYFVVASV